MALKAEQSKTLPMPGDVLITSASDRHLLSIVPHPHRLSFKDLSAAKSIATKWAQATGCDLWHEADGVVRKLQAD